MYYKDIKGVTTVKAVGKNTSDPTAFNDLDKLAEKLGISRYRLVQIADCYRMRLYQVPSNRRFIASSDVSFLEEAVKLLKKK